LDGSRGIQSQIQLINLPGPASSDSGSTGISPYEALHSYIHLAVAPYFDAYAREKGVNELVNVGGKKHDDSRMGIYKLMLIIFFNENHCKLLIYILIFFLKVFQWPKRKLPN
jgi:hypothetical protein